MLIYISARFQPDFTGADDLSASRVMCRLRRATAKLNKCQKNNSCSPCSLFLQFSQSKHPPPPAKPNSHTSLIEREGGRRQWGNEGAQVSQDRTGSKWKRQGSVCGVGSLRERETHRDDVQDAQQTVHTVTGKNLLHHRLRAVLGKTKHKTQYLL